jgi:hypothetical protein
VATPPLSVLDPNVIVPSLKVTAPVAADGIMVAVNVMLVPKLGLTEDVVSAVVVDVVATETDIPELVLVE